MGETIRESWSTFLFMVLLLFSNSILDYKHGIRLKTNIDGKVLITLNARNEHDRSKFVEDLREAILEVKLFFFIYCNHIIILSDTSIRKCPKVCMYHGYWHSYFANKSGRPLLLLEWNIHGYVKRQLLRCRLFNDLGNCRNKVGDQETTKPMSLMLNVCSYRWMKWKL